MNFGPNKDHLILMSVYWSKNRSHHDESWMTGSNRGQFRTIDFTLLSIHYLDRIYSEREPLMLCLVTFLIHLKLIHIKLIHLNLSVWNSFIWNWFIWKRIVWNWFIWKRFFKIDSEQMRLIHLKIIHSKMIHMKTIHMKLIHFKLIHT